MYFTYLRPNTLPLSYHKCFSRTMFQYIPSSSLPSFTTVTMATIVTTIVVVAIMTIVFTFLVIMVMNLIAIVPTTSFAITTASYRYTLDFNYVTSITI